MILGISTPLFTQIHVAISLIGIVSGVFLTVFLIAGRLPTKVNALFLITTVLTSVTGFFFPIHGVTPGIVVGIVSLIVLAVTLFALHGKHLAGGWRKAFVISALFALYLNSFVLIAQLFQKVPALHVLAPTGTETPFKLSQLALFVVFIGVTTLAVKKFKPALAP
jgi:hypothetical protein